MQINHFCSYIKDIIKTHLFKLCQHAQYNDLAQPGGAAQKVLNGPQLQQEAKELLYNNCYQCILTVIII